MQDKVINGFHIRFGISFEEYHLLYGGYHNSGDLWDFSLEDIENGAIEPNEDMVYWGIEIDGEMRIFETLELVNEEI